MLRIKAWLFGILFFLYANSSWANIGDSQPANTPQGNPNTQTQAQIKTPQQTKQLIDKLFKHADYKHFKKSSAPDLFNIPEQNNGN